METYDLAEAAQRSGVSVEALRRYVDLEILKPDGEGRFTPADLRRAGLVESLIDSGIPLDGFAAAMHSGQVSLAFLDAPTFDRFSAFSGVTFAQLAERMGVSVELLMSIREAAGGAAPRATDRVRDEELPLAEMVHTSIEVGMRPAAVEQMLRVQGDGLRRVAETESSIWKSEIILPAIMAGKGPDEIFGNDVSDRMSVLLERSIVGMYHLQQGHAWTVDIIEGLEAMMAQAGLHSRLDHPPAMCFLDITGYTRLTQEQGDAAAANLAETLGRLVHRSAVKYGGRAVKWLGDGVMLHYPNPGHGVQAALEMVAGATEAGLPPAHVGLHAGPVIFQEGDYYGQTVNVASRIADYARPSEVVVSQAVVDACVDAPVTFRDVGDVELKGVAGAMHLHVASASG